jgi:hypothetical protein
LMSVMRLRFARRTIPPYRATKRATRLSAKGAGLGEMTKVRSLFIEEEIGIARRRLDQLAYGAS